MTQSRLGSEYDDPNEGAFITPNRAICARCRNDDHSECAIILWTTGACQCPCNIKEDSN